MDNVTDKNPANPPIGTYTIKLSGERMYGEETPFHLAAQQGQLAVCQLMVQELSDKNPAATTSRVTPLHYAAQYGHVDICKLILENVVDKDPTDIGCFPYKTPPNDRSTPLSRAKAHGKSEVCQLFHEYGIH